MSIIKARKKRKSYTQIDNTAIFDKNLSFRATGLLTYLLAMPSSWEVKVVHLCKQKKEGRDAIYACLKELKEHGYVRLVPTKEDTTNKFSGWDYIVYESPNDLIADEQGLLEFEEEPLPGNPEVGSPLPGKPLPGKPLPGKPFPGNPHILNKHIEKKNILKKQQQINANSNSSTSKELKSSAANSNLILKGKDLLIDHETLNDNQLQYVQTQLIKQELNAPNLFEEICFTLLNKNHFAKSGNDFLKKLNTILKTIREGQWSTPIELEEKKQDRIKQRERKIKVQRDLLLSEFNHSKSMENEFKKQNKENDAKF